MQAVMPMLLISTFQHSKFAHSDKWLQVAYLQQLEAQGDAQAQANLGYRHLHGVGVEQDHAMARPLLERAGALARLEKLIQHSPIMTG
jgi:TPR repeat protein